MTLDYKCLLYTSSSVVVNLCIFCICCVRYVCKTVHWGKIRESKDFVQKNTACQTDGYCNKMVVFHPDDHIDLCI